MADVQQIMVLSIVIMVCLGIGLGLSGVKSCHGITPDQLEMILTRVSLGRSVDASQAASSNQVLVAESAAPAASDYERNFATRLEREKALTHAEKARSRRLREGLADIVCQPGASNKPHAAVNGGYCLTPVLPHTREVSPGNTLAVGHFFDDPGFSTYLSSVFPQGGSVLELGAGIGQYKAAVGKQRSDLHWDAHDAAVNIENYTQGFVQYFDVCDPWPFEWEGNYDWVLSIEMAEHIPPRCEDNLLALLASVPRVGVIVSWSETVSYPMHPNGRSNEYVKSKMAALDFKVDAPMEEAARESVNDLKYLQTTIMTFRKPNNK